jgi:hypothetical protein
MALSDLWLASPGQLADKHVRQIISFAGTGQLRDGGEASAEFRDFLSKIPSTLLARYAEECLHNSFDGSGFALQDVVNQLGRRLGFAVTHGRYRGTVGQVGFDGLWRFPDGHAVVVEVKTTDAYRIDLNVLAGYRKALIGLGECAEDRSSILIVVGRQDTGDLEAQIRGSRHAWDVRLISVDALLRLVKLKEEVEDPKIIEQICAVLIPKEYTRLDSIVDIVFSAAEDVKEEPVLNEDDEEEAGQDEVGGPKFIPVSFNDACAARVQSYLGIHLVKHSKALFSSADNEVAVMCGASREHGKGDQSVYWFAFHPYQKTYLDAAAKAYVAFGCGSEDTVVLIPHERFSTWLDGLNVTKKEDRYYWHVKIHRDEDKLVLRRRKGLPPVDLSEYLLPKSQAKGGV